MKCLFILKKMQMIIILFLLISNSCNKKKDLPLIEDASLLSKYAGQKVIVIGQISQVQWQHTIRYIKTHPVAINFDVGNMQIIIYSKRDIDTKEKLKITGKVIKVDWESEKAGNNSKFSEYHIIVDNYEVIKR